MVEVVVFVKRLRHPQRDAVDDRKQVVQQPPPEKRVVQKIVGHALVIRAIEKHEQRTQPRQSQPRPRIEHVERENRQSTLAPPSSTSAPSFQWWAKITRTSTVVGQKWRWVQAGEWFTGKALHCNGLGNQSRGWQTRTPSGWL